VNRQRYICSGNFDTYKNFLGLIAQEFKKKAPAISVNPFILKFIATLSPLFSLFRNTPILTSESIKSMESVNQFDSSKISAEIDFKFRTSKETIQWTIPYYVEKYNL